MRISLPWQLGLRRMPHEARAAAARSCRQVALDLRRVCSATERDFLAVGGQLEDILGLAREESETINALLEALSGESASALGDALDVVTAWANVERGRAHHGGTLQTLLPVVLAVRMPLQELGGAARMLRVTGVVTRVESARLGDHAAGFLSLANDVARLAGYIEEKSESVSAAVGGLCPLIEQSSRTISLREERQNRDLLQLLEQCRGALLGLHAEQERLAAGSMRSQQGYDRVMQEIGRTVVALQFHDSTRQRLEHIAEALDRAAAGLESSGSAAETGAIVALQSAQLREARRTFSTSVGVLRDNLETTHRLTEDLLHAAHDASGADRNYTASAEGAVGLQFSAVAKTIEEWKVSRRSQLNTASQVAHGCESVGTFVSDIQEIGILLLRLALNAEVEAVRLSDSGAVMEAVAEGIRGVSQLASSHAQEATRALATARQRVTEFNSHLSEDGISEDMESALATIRGLGTNLRQADSRCHALFVDILERGSELSRRMAEVMQQLTADIVMNQVTDRCLDSLAAVAAAAPGSAKEAANLGQLAAAIESYTMDHEREIHNAVTGQSGADSDSCGGLEENVELF